MPAAFDLASAKPVDSGGGFDLASARPVASGKSAAAESSSPSFPDTSLTAENIAGGAWEPAAAMLSGAIAKPVSDVAGLAAVGKEMVSPTPGGGDPEGFKRYVQESLTYRPRTGLGQINTQYDPLALAGQGVNWLGQQANEAIAPPSAGPMRSALGAGVGEAMQQAPAFAGLKSGPLAAPAAGMLKSGAQRVMQSALKPTEVAQRTGKAATAIDTMLDQGLNVSPGGVSKIHARVSQLNDQVKEAIKNSTAVINKEQVAKRVLKPLNDFMQQVDPLTDVAAIQRVWDHFMEHPELPKEIPAHTVASKVLDASGQPIRTEVPKSGSNDFPVQKAQELKTGTYRALGDKSYGELKGAEIEAQKALARGLKEEISNAVPEVRPLNAEESRLLDALSVSERRVMMEANKNPIGLGFLSASPVKLAMWMADRSGLFKSLVARMLNTGSKAVPQMARTGPALGIGTSAAAMAPQAAPEFPSTP